MLATLGALLAAALVLQNSTALGEAAAPPSALRATELIIVDGAGVERVRVGGDLPDAVIDGRRIDRGSKVAGVMLYDRTGQERGGYVTFDEGDNIALTLDGRQGQNALFATGPDGATVMQVWHGRQSIEMRADSSGARLSHMHDGMLAWQHPEVSAISTETCGLFRDGLRAEVPAGVPMEQVRGICERRFPAKACDTCLGSP